VQETGAARGRPRASLSAASTDSVPLLAKKTISKLAGASETSFSAKAAA